MVNVREILCYYLYIYCGFGLFASCISQTVSSKLGSRHAIDNTILFALCDGVHGKGQHQLGLGEISISKKKSTSPFASTMQVNLTRDTSLADMQSTLLQGTEFGLRNQE